MIVSDSMQRVGAPIGALAFCASVGVYKRTLMPGAGRLCVQNGWRMRTSKEAHDLYRSTAWLDVRQAYIIERNGLCERCGRPGIIVHHKKYLTSKTAKQWDIALNTDNLELLCIDCHNKEHKRAETTRRKGMEWDRIVHG